MALTTSKVTPPVDRSSSSRLRPRPPTTWRHQPHSKRKQVASAQLLKITRKNTKLPANMEQIRQSSPSWVTHQTAPTCPAVSTKTRRNQQRRPRTSKDSMPAGTSMTSGRTSRTSACTKIKSMRSTPRSGPNVEWRIQHQPQQLLREALNQSISHNLPEEPVEFTRP